MRQSSDVERAASDTISGAKGALQQGKRYVQDKMSQISEGVKDLGSGTSGLRETAERGVGAREHHEGRTTKAIEYFTSQVPSGAYLGLAVGSIAVSALCQLYGRKEDANFIGQWVPTILIMGLYNKLVKLEGSE